jgi:hypothetical protein
MLVSNPFFYIVVSLDILIKRNSNFESKYDSFVPNKTQIKFAKFVLGVHKSATHIAVLSELGLFPLYFVL